MREYIPVCEPALFGNELDYVIDAVKTGWISSAGKYISKFENAFAEYCGVKHGIAVSNGTVALHLAMVALGIQKHDEVIIPNFTMIASAFAVTYTGAIPVFVDAESETWNIDVNKIEEKITSRTKAIMAVHIYGHPCDMKKIEMIAKKYNLFIIEDAAEAHGAVYYGKKSGSLSDVAAFSFFANKIATTGEGGMVLTNDDIIAEKCRYYKNMCFQINGPRNYLHNDIGYNYRLSNLHAAIGLAQIENIDEYVNRRIENHKAYAKYLSTIPGIIFQEEKIQCKHVYWMNSILVDPLKYGIDRDQFAKELQEHGIDTRPLFKGMNTQPALKKYTWKDNNSYPVTDMLSARGLYLPSSSSLEIEKIQYIADVIYQVHLKYK